jgi:2-phospho-L-lactate/phosphoenolpyruvate guanylyltransferase
VTPWTLVLPVKGGPRAKSRLGAPPAVAAAIALDCLDAVLACAAVGTCLVVSADVATQRSARLAGARVVPESRPGSGLVAAIGDGLAAASRRPWCARPAAVLLADLPALRPEDLQAALHAARSALDGDGVRMAAIPDADGTGTVLLAARTPSRLDPAFGPRSFAEHLRRGAVPVPLDSPRLRRDVDTPADLDAALALGVGPRTASALAERTA